MLFAITCKVIEPALFAWQFHKTAQAENIDVYDEQTREIAFYHPLPYHSGEEQLDSQVSELYQENDKFYHVVERHFSNDTFYIKIQDNLSAREQFFALGDAVKEIDTKDTQQSDNQPIKKNLSLEDLSKVCSPTAAAAIVSENWTISRGSYQLYGDVSFFIPLHCLSVPSPPPNA